MSVMYNICNLLEVEGAFLFPQILFFLVCTEAFKHLLCIQILFTDLFIVYHSSVVHIKCTIKGNKTENSKLIDNSFFFFLEGFFKIGSFHY